MTGGGSHTCHWLICQRESSRFCIYDGEDKTEISDSRMLLLFSLQPWMKSFHHKSQRWRGNASQSSSNEANLCGAVCVYEGMLLTKGDDRTLGSLSWARGRPVIKDLHRLVETTAAQRLWLQLQHQRGKVRVTLDKNIY